MAKQTVKKEQKQITLDEVIEKAVIPKKKEVIDDKPTKKYVLFAKYNGIQLGHAGDPMRNGEMTESQAKELLEKHPHGAKLFSKIPK